MTSLSFWVLSTEAIMTHGYNCHWTYWFSFSDRMKFTPAQKGLKSDDTRGYHKKVPQNNLNFFGSDAVKFKIFFDKKT